MTTTHSINDSFHLHYPQEMVPEEKNGGGGKNCQSTDSQQSNKIFMDHALQIGLKCDYTLQKYNKKQIIQDLKCRQWVEVPMRGLN